MTLTKTIWQLCLAAAFYSCKKEDIQLASNSVYHKTKKEVIAQTRVFAKSGEIRIGAIINRYLQLDSTWISQQTSILGGPDTISIINDQEARLFESSVYRQYFYLTSDHDIRFTAKDTSIFYTGMEVYTRSLRYHIGKYKPVIYKEQLISSTTGYYFFECTGKREIYITESDDVLRAHWMMYINHSPTNYAVEWIANKLNPDFYHMLGAKDTLVLQEYSILYERVK